MIGKSECWTNIIGSILLIILDYLILYYSPNFEQLKIVIPFLGFAAGYIFLNSINNLEEINKGTW